MARSLPTLAAAAALVLAIPVLAAPANAQRPERPSQPWVKGGNVQADSGAQCNCDRWPTRNADLARMLDQLRSPRSDSSGNAAQLRRRLNTEMLGDLSGRAAVQLYSNEPGSRMALVRAFEQAAMAPDRAMLGISIGSEASTRGLEVADISADGPAARAGIHTGDMLTAVDGTSLRVAPADSGDDVMGGAVARRLTRRLDSASAGDTITLRVANGAGAERTVRVSTVRADELTPALQRIGSLNQMASVLAMAGRVAPLGVRVRSTDSPRDSLGVFIASVVTGSAADHAGIHEGMRVVAVDGRDLRVNPADVGDRAVTAARVSQLARALADVKAGGSVVLRVRDGRETRDVTVTVTP